MATNYIIKYRGENDENYIDGYLEITKKYNLSTITISTKKDKFTENYDILLFEYIFSENIEVSFNDELFESKINNSIIKFDSNSSSAWTNYRTLLETIINTKNEIEKYSSGNIKCIGDILYEDNKRKLHGNGTIFYDLPTKNIMYAGEFENGYFDGTGVFFSSDGNITLDVNNISRGVPILIGTINIKYQDYKITTDIIFTEIWKKLNINTNAEIVSLVSSDKFIDTIANLVWDHIISYEEYKLESMSLHDKYEFMYSKIKALELLTINNGNLIRKLTNNNLLQFLTFIFILIIAISSNLFLLYVLN